MKARHQRGFTLIELVVAFVLGCVVLAACVAMFHSSLVVRMHLDGELSRSRSLTVIARHLVHDVREANLGLAQVIYEPEPAPGQPRGLAAIALPCAREMGSDRFVTDSGDGRPAWQRIRVYFVLPNDTRMQVMDLVPDDPTRIRPAPAPSPTPLISQDTLRDYCMNREGRRSPFAVAGQPHIVSRSTDWLGAQIEGKRATLPDGREEFRFHAVVGLKVFYCERGSTVRKYATLRRVIFSDNSMYQDPGPARTPVPVPMPPMPPPDLSLDRLVPVAAPAPGVAGREPRC